MFRKSAALHEKRQKIEYPRPTPNVSGSSKGQHRHQQPLKIRYKSKTLEALFKILLDDRWWKTHSVSTLDDCFHNVSIPQNPPQCLIHFNPPQSTVFAQDCSCRFPWVALVTSPSCAAASAGSPPFPPGWSTGSAPPCGRAGRATLPRSLTEAGIDGLKHGWNMVETWLKHGWKHGWNMVETWIETWLNILFSTISRQIFSVKSMVFLPQGV